MRQAVRVNMVVFLVYVSTFLLQNTLADNEECKGDLKTTFQKETMATDLYIPREFAIDKSLNILYLTHGHAVDQFAQVDLKNGHLFNFHGVFSHSQTVNQETHEVYIATKTGIYRFDYNLRTFQYVAASNKAVNSVFFYNNTLFFTETGSKQLYMLENGRVLDAGSIQKQTNDDHVAVDGEGTIFFTFGDMLFSLNNGDEFVAYEKSRGLIIREIGSDNSGGILACTEYGIFYVNKKAVSLGEALAGSTQNCMSVGTDGDNNIIYSDGNSVVKIVVGLQCINFEDEITR